MLSKSEYLEEIIIIRNRLRKYKLKDIYNMYETGLSYQLLNSYSIGSESFKGSPDSKKRISVALTVNASGTRILKTLIVNKFKNPRWHKNFNPNDITYYYNNPRAWVTGSIFQSYLNNISRQFDNKIALLVDNCPCHTIKDLKIPKNIDLIFLPPGTTSLFQPLDLGIIRSFKSIYRANVLSSYHTEFLRTNTWTLTSNKKIQS